MLRLSLKHIFVTLSCKKLGKIINIKLEYMWNYKGYVVWNYKEYE